MFTILGWLGHGNVGDESYKLTFPMFLQQPCIFTDKLVKADKVILGGGNIVSQEFLQQLENVKEKYIVSVGLTPATPFHLIKNFKRIIVRDKISLDLLAQNNIKAELMPDLAFLLTPNKQNGEKFIKNAFANKHRYQKIVCVTLNAYLPTTLARDAATFQYVVNHLAQIIDSTNASFLFIPYGQKEPHNDFVTNGWLASQCKFWQKNVVLYQEIDPQTVLDIVSCCDAAINTRLHGSIFCCVGNTPFVDITHHSKNDNFLEEINRKEWSVPYWQFDPKKCKNLIDGFLNNKEDLSSIAKTQKNRIENVHRL